MKFYSFLNSKRVPGKPLPMDKCIKVSLHRQHQIRALRFVRLVWQPSWNGVHDASSLQKKRSNIFLRQLSANEKPLTFEAVLRIGMLATSFVLLTNSFVNEDHMSKEITGLFEIYVKNMNGNPEHERNNSEAPITFEQFKLLLDVSCFVNCVLFLTSYLFFICGCCMLACFVSFKPRSISSEHSFA